MQAARECVSTCAARVNSKRVGRRRAQCHPVRRVGDIVVAPNSIFMSYVPTDTAGLKLLHQQSQVALSYWALLCTLQGLFHGRVRGLLRVQGSVGRNVH